MAPDYGPPQGSTPEGAPAPIPPYVEGPPVQAAGGGYCFDGPHPVDTRVVPGATWDNATGRHVHPYPPFDLRLFSFEKGCYYFIGDPTDFGYAGSTYSYYGAHPILAAYGGGWCFMIGPHHHAWRPWSPLFVTVGPWFYWQGSYDPFFWTYWPYYHFYYRSHYPVYYARGAFFRSHVVAPRIPVVPRPLRYGSAWHGGYRGGFNPRAGIVAPGNRPLPSPRGPGPATGATMPRGPAPGPAGRVMQAAPPRVARPGTEYHGGFSPPRSAPAARFGADHFSGRGRR